MRIRAGQRDLWMASKKFARTVVARLLVVHFKNTINLQYPSTQPWMTKRHFISLWFPSICLQEKNLSYRTVSSSILRILTGKKHSQIKLQCFYKVWISTFGWLVHQLNSLREINKLKQNFPKIKAVTGKTPFFVIYPFCTPNSISPGFW